MSRLDRRTLRRVKQHDRNRLIRGRKVDTQNDDMSQRKRIEKLWEQSINFFADNAAEGEAKGGTNGKT